MLGSKLGIWLGNALGTLDGIIVGSNVGLLGTFVGTAVGSNEGNLLGIFVGINEGGVGTTVGSNEGCLEGTNVGNGLEMVSIANVAGEMDDTDINNYNMNDDEVGNENENENESSEDSHPSLLFEGNNDEETGMIEHNRNDNVTKSGDILEADDALEEMRALATANGEDDAKAHELSAKEDYDTNNRKYTLDGHVRNEAQSSVKKKEKDKETKGAMATKGATKGKGKGKKGNKKKTAKGPTKGGLV